MVKARALARGHLRGGKAVLWTPDLPTPVAAAQIVKQNLHQIGLEVEIKPFPLQAYFREAAKSGAPFDIAFGAWAPDVRDPYQYINALFGRTAIIGANIAHFDEPKYNALMEHAGRLNGDERYRTYGRLDVQLARDAVPMIAVSFDNDATLVSKRVGCIVLRPGSGLDLTAACLK